MLVTLNIELDDGLIKLWLRDNPAKSQEDFFEKFNNTVILGGDCINGMLERTLDISVNFYVDASIVQLSN